MNDLTLQFQEQQISYCANFMFGNAEQFFTTLRDVSAIIKQNEFLPTDEVTASISPENLLSLSGLLGTQQETLTAAFHKTLNDSLLSQLMTIAGGQDEDAAASANYVLQELQNRATSAGAWLQNQIAAGRNKLKQ